MVVVYYTWGNQKLSEEEKKMTSEEGLNNFFVEKHRVELADGDEFIESLWQRTRPQSYKLH